MKSLEPSHDDYFGHLPHRLFALSLVVGWLLPLVVAVWHG